MSYLARKARWVLRVESREPRGIACTEVGSIFNGAESRIGLVACVQRKKKTTRVTDMTFQTDATLAALQLDIRGNGSCATLDQARTSQVLYISSASSDN